jgi:hypothetical protein
VHRKLGVLLIIARGGWSYCAKFWRTLFMERMGAFRVASSLLSREISMCFFLFLLLKVLKENSWKR